MGNMWKIKGCAANIKINRKYINTAFVKRISNEKKTLNLYLEVHIHDKNIAEKNVMNSSS